MMTGRNMNSITLMGIIIVLAAHLISTVFILLSRSRINKIDKHGWQTAREIKQGLHNG